MKKYKFSEKLPEVGKKLVCKVKGQVDIFIVKDSEFIESPRLYRFRKTPIIGNDVFFLDKNTELLDWWADPEEGE